MVARVKLIRILIVILLFCLILLTLQNKQGSFINGFMRRLLKPCQLLPPPVDPIYSLIKKQEKCVDLKYSHTIPESGFSNSRFPLILQQNCNISGLEIERNMAACQFIEVKERNPTICDTRFCPNHPFVAITPYHNIEDRLNLFLDHFAELMRKDSSLNLIISTLPADEDRVSHIAKSKLSSDALHRFKVVLDKSNSLSRGRLRNNGATEALDFHGKDATFFFTDIDVFSSLHFMKRCQTFAATSRSVYFPIIWSQKKPQSPFPNSNPTNEELLTQHKLSRRTDTAKVESVRLSDIQKTLQDEAMNIPGVSNTDEGFWRAYGYGMSCMRASDFKRLGGFPEYSNWGNEDTDFYKKAVRSDLTVFRLHDAGLVHKWHPKSCSDADIRNTKSWLQWFLRKPSACESVLKQHLQ